VVNNFTLSNTTENIDAPEQPDYLFTFSLVSRMQQKTVSTVLVRPIYSRNIGAVCRAMANMGVNRLVLIAPECELDAEARMAASHAQAHLKNCTIYSSLKDFQKKEGEGLRIAMTARSRKVRPTVRLDKALQEFSEKNNELWTHSGQIYFIFGPEDSGLSLEDLHLCHRQCHLPTYSDYTSLNLAQAVLLTFFIFRRLLEDIAESETKTNPPSTERPSENEPRPKPTYHPEQTIQTWLETLGFDLSQQRLNVFTVLNRLLLENTPTEKELRILETVLQQNIRKLREKDRKKNS
jgi:tRNA/rRNA methyltransferase